MVNICHQLALSKSTSEILPFVTVRMKLDGIVLSEISEMENNSNGVISLIWNIKQKQSE